MTPMNSGNSNLRKRILCTTCAFCAFLLIFMPGGEAFAGPPRHVIIIGWEGGQREQLNDLLARNELPNLQELAKEGTRVDISATSGAEGIKAGWSRLLTGYEPDKTGVESNGRYQPIPAGYTIFERAKQALGADNIYTALIAAQSIPGERYVNAKSGMDFFRDGLQTTNEVAKLALQTIDEHKNKRMLLFIHLSSPGPEGQSNSGNPKGQDQGIKQEDAWTGVLLRRLRGLGIYKDTLIYIVVSDSFDEGQKSDKSASSIFLATNDKQVRRNGDSIDFAPTILIRLGIDVAAIVPKLDGMSLTQAKSQVKTAALR
jgi:hypothetical protein